MELNTLKIHNIASIEDATIDFSNGPLADDHIFLICGPTGSGKTTILDCISMVLFDKTARFENEHKNSFRDTNDEETKTDDLRQFMRRGSGECRIELNFTVNGETFTAIWECNRANKKANGKLQSKKRRILDSTGTSIAEKTEVKNFIEEKLNMTYDQFCKTTMLAQGEFTKFLKSDEREKSDILEKLTGTAIYSEIGSRIFRTAADKENNVNLISKELEGIHILTEEEIEEKKGQIRQLEQDKTEAGNVKDKLTALKTWLETEADLEGKAQNATTEFQDALKEKESEEYKERAATIGDWKASDTARRLLRTEEEKKAALDDLERKKGDMESEFRSLLEGKNFLEASVAQEEEKLEIQKGIRDEFAQNSGTYENITTISSHFGEIKGYEKDITDTTAAIKELSDKIPELEEDIRKKDEMQKTAEATDNSNKTDLENKEKELKAYDISALNLERKNIDSQIGSLEELVKLIGFAIEAKNDLEKNRQEIENAGEKIKENERLVAELKISDLERDAEEKKNLFEKAEASCKDFVKELRHKLNVGDTCPVCGKKIEEHLNDGQFTSVLEPLKEAKEKVERTLSEAKDKAAGYNGEIAAQRGIIEKATKAEAGLIETVQDAENERDQHPLYATYRSPENSQESTQESTLGSTLESTQEITLKKIAEAINSLREEKTAVSDKLEKIGKLEKERQALQEKKNGSAVALTTAKEDYRKALKAKEDNDGEIAKKEEIVGNKKNDITNKISLLNRLITIERWEETWKKDRTSFETELADEAKQYNDAVDAITTLAPRVSQGKQSLGTVVDTISGIRTLAVSYSAITTDEKTGMENLQSSCARFKGQLEIYLQQLHDAREKVETAQQELSAYLVAEGSLPLERLKELEALKTQEIEALEGTNRKIDDDIIKKEAARDLSEKALKQHRDQKPELDAGNTGVKKPELDAGNTDGMNPENEDADEMRRAFESKDTEKLKAVIDEITDRISSYDSQKGSLETELGLNEDRKAEFQDKQEKKEKAEKESADWKQLCDLFGSADGKKFRTIAQSFVLGNLIDCANIHLRKFSERYEISCQPGSLAILVRDIDAGGITRPASTLSGGESFVVSLSLALGLSSLTKMENSIDTLFIDEGFGTLDGTYLPKVLEALEKLHADEGKKIGIISHVELLRDRIPTKIKVTPEGTKSTIEVVNN